MKSNSKYTIKKACKVLGQNRQNYYSILDRKKKKDAFNMLVIDYVKRIRKNMPMIGVRKLRFSIEKEFGLKVGRDKLFNLLRQEKMLINKRKKKVITTNSNHPYKKYKNAIKHITVTHAEEVFVSDITYIRTREGFCYLHLVSDIYSKYIMGYCITKDLGSLSSLESLTKSLQNKKYDTSLIHHSDRGIQYCSHEYINTLINNNIKISMTESGDPKDNAVAERINGILKKEFGLKKIFDNFEDAKKSILKAIFIYNNFRPHLSCGYLTPAEAHIKGYGLKQCWKYYYKKLAA